MAEEVVLDGGFSSARKGPAPGPRRLGRGLAGLRAALLLAGLLPMGPGAPAPSQLDRLLRPAALVVWVGGGPALRC